MKLVKILKNEEGVALVTSLMLTLLSLVVVSTALYLMTLSTKQGGVIKSYKTAMQASYGGSDMVLKDMIPKILMKSDALISGPVQAIQDIQAGFPGIGDLAIAPGYANATVSAACLRAKLNGPPPWSDCPSPGSGVTADSLRPKDLPDMVFTVPGALGSTPFKVYSKIVDTTPGNSDISGVSLMGAGVAESQNNITPQHIPYVFRVEVQAERSTNATEKANLSLLYAY